MTSPIATNNKYLMMADANQIQAYLFEAVKLKDIMGASLVLKEFDKKIKENLTKLGPGVEAVAAGGKVLVELDDINQAEKAANLIVQTYQGITVTSTIGVSDPQPFVYSNSASFRIAYAAAESSLRRNKNLGGQYSAMLIADPHMLHCSVCGLRPAEKTRWIKDEEGRNDEKEALCTTCQEKRKFSEKNPALFVDNIIQYLKSKHSRSIDLNGPQDFNQIGGYVGYIVADGNRMGEKLSKCGSLKEYHDWSLMLEACLIEALQEAITIAFRLDDAKTLKEFEGKNNYLPLQVLVMGGDDLVIVTTAETVLPLASIFCRRFNEISAAKLAELAQKYSQTTKSEQLSISAGVVLAKANLPFLISHHLADELLESAKRLSRSRHDYADKELGALDFQVITASNALELKQIRQEQTFFEPEKPRNNVKRLVFTARPYAAEPLQANEQGSVEFKQLLKMIADLKKAELPRSQLANFNEILNTTNAAKSGQSFDAIYKKVESEYTRQVSRLTAERELRQKWQALESLADTIGPRAALFAQKPLAPHKPEEWVTLPPDVIELYEFVGKGWAEEERWELLT